MFLKRSRLSWPIASITFIASLKFYPNKFPIKMSNNDSLKKYYRSQPPSLPKCWSKFNYFCQHITQIHLNCQYAYNFRYYSLSWVRLTHFKKIFEIQFILKLPNYSNIQPQHINIYSDTNQDKFIQQIFKKI